MENIKRMLKRRATRLLLKLVDANLIDFEFIEAQLDQVKAGRCYKGASVADSARFYESARVVNLQQNPASVRVGKNTHIRGELTVFAYGGKIEIGEGCYIGEGTRVWSGDSIVMGDCVGVAHNVNIIDFAHETHYITRAEGVKRIFATGHPTEKGDIPTAPIVIEDYAAIYANSSILRGVRIGKGSIVSTGSVVMSDAPPFSILMGNPARVMGKLPSE
ncbi:MAG: acyltransferase [Terrimicrobiaceae bacterium]|nr:acyltransferase [Terrimicrobiaceae bacterium]